MESVNVNNQHEQGHYQSGDVDALDYCICNALKNMLSVILLIF